MACFLWHQLQTATSFEKIIGRLASLSILDTHEAMVNYQQILNMLNHMTTAFDGVMTDDSVLEWIRGLTIRILLSIFILWIPIAKFDFDIESHVADEISAATE